VNQKVTGSQFSVPHVYSKMKKKLKQKAIEQSRVREGSPMVSTVGWTYRKAVQFSACVINTALRQKP